MQEESTVVHVPLIGHSSVYLTVYIMVECLEGENKIRKEGERETGVRRACRQLWVIKNSKEKGRERRHREKARTKKG